ncbi:MAG: ABC transporter permease [Arenicellales bacterium]
MSASAESLRRGIPATAGQRSESASADARAGSSATGAYLLVPMLLFFILLIIAVLRSPSLVTADGIGSAIIVATPLILATYAIMPIAIAGRASVDLSVGPLIGFINVTLITLYDGKILSSPAEFFVYAIVVGLLYQLLMSLIIVYVRVQPIIVALSGYLAFSGINLVIMQRPGGVAPDWMMSWGLGTSIWSPVTAILVLATLAWVWFSRSAFYGHLHLMGSDERAAYTSGVRIYMVRIGAHLIGGVYAALAAITFTSLISSGDPTQGTTYTLIAVTALVLGGTSVAGGRGGVVGSLLGAVNIYLITYVLATFNFGAVQSFVTDLAYGVVLVLSLLLILILPWIRRTFRNISPLLFFVLLSMVALGVIIHKTYDYRPPPAPKAAQEAVQGGATGQAGAPAAQMPAATRTATGRSAFIFESPAIGTSAEGGSVLAKPVTFAALLLLILLVVLRVSVSQARGRTLAPLVYVIVAALIVLCVQIITGSGGPGSISGVVGGHR